MRAEKYVVLPDEDAAEFQALEAALLEELAVGALQSVLARRIARAAWRLARADRSEPELFAERHAAGGLGPAVIRDGNGTRSFETLLRYRGAALAEFWRALRTLKALQAETRVPLAAGAEAAVPARAPVGAVTVAAGPAAGPRARSAARAEHPNEPEPCRSPGVPGRSGDRANPSGAPRASDPTSARVCHLQQAGLSPGALAQHTQPNEPRRSSSSNLK
jgi:hypothetical protein